MASGASSIDRLMERLRQLQEEVTSIAQNNAESKESRRGLQQEIEAVRRLQASVTEDAQAARASKAEEAKEAHEIKVKGAQASRKEALDAIKEAARKINTKSASELADADAEYKDLLEKHNAEHGEQEKKLRAQRSLKLDELEDQLKEVDSQILSNEAKAEALQQNHAGADSQNRPISNSSEPNSRTPGTHLLQDQVELPDISPSCDTTEYPQASIPAAIIALHGNKTVAISCNYCGANANRAKQQFFKGILGANKHVRHRHTDRALGTNLTTNMSHLKVVELAQGDLAMIRTSTKEFPMDFGDDTKQVAALKPDARPSHIPVSTPKSSGEHTGTAFASGAKNDDRDDEELKGGEDTTVVKQSGAVSRKVSGAGKSTVAHPVPTGPTSTTSLGDRQRPNSGKYLGYIHADFPTVVNTAYHGEYFYSEISCAICDANTDAEGKFFRGKTGLLQHVQQAHDSHASLANPSWRRIRSVTEGDVRSMANGKPPRERPIVKQAYPPDDSRIETLPPRNNDRKLRTESPDTASQHARPRLSGMQGALPSTPEIGLGNEQPRNDGRKNGTIHERFPMVVKIESQNGARFYCEISCGICGANADAGGKFFEGKKGLHEHVKNAHDPDADQTKPTSRRSQRIGETDVGSMLRGQDPQNAAIVKRPFRPNALLDRQSVTSQSNGRKRGRGSPEATDKNARPRLAGVQKDEESGSRKEPAAETTANPRLRDREKDKELYRR